MNPYDNFDDDSLVLPSAINVVVGIWLVCSPFVLGYRADDPLAIHIVSGTAIGTCAYLRASRAARTASLSWANVAIGAWMCASGLVLDSSAIAGFNASICGLVVVLLATTSALTTGARTT